MEERLAAVSRELLRGTRVLRVHWIGASITVCCTVPGTIHRTRAVCSVHHVATANMEPTELGFGEKVVYLVNEGESVWDPLFPQEAADAVGVFSEGLTNLKSCTSPANLEKEMKGRYPSQLFSQ